MPKAPSNSAGPQSLSMDTPSQPIPFSADTPQTYDSGVAPVASPMTRDGAVSGDNSISTFGYSKPLDVLLSGGGYNYFLELENQLKKIANQLDLIDEKAENAIGQEKINYLNQQVALYKEQQNVQKSLINDMTSYQSSLKSYLSGKGFGFDSIGNVTNYHTKLLAMESELKRLEDIANKDGASDSQKKNAENYKNSLDDIKKVMDEYVKVTFTELPDARKEWESLSNSIIDSGKSIKEAQNELEKFNRSQKLFSHENKIDALKNEYDKLSDSVDLLDEKLKNAYGSEKVRLIEQQIKLFDQQKQKQTEIIDSYKRMIEVYKKDLSGYGFRFDANSDVTNMAEILDKFEGSEDLEKVKELLEDYIKVQRDELPDAKLEWESLNNAIIESQSDIREAREELQKFLSEVKVDILTDKFNDLQHEISMVDKLLKHSSGRDKLDLLSKKTELLKQQQIELQKQMDYFNNEKNSIQGYLQGNGFVFDSNGNIVNYISQLEKLADSSSDFDKIKDKLEEYFELQDDKLPGLEEDWVDLGNSIKDALKEQLEVTKEVQDKIKEIYKKQVEERKKLIDEELDARLSALDKEKKAYQDYRKEVDYENDYNDQADKVNNLQKEIDRLSQDDSLGGKKRLEELLKQLKDEQKKLEDLVQNKIDSDVENMFDKESDRLESEADKAKDDLDDKYSDEKLQQIVKDTLSSGLFEDIDGNIKDLGKTFLEFEDKFGDGLSAIGGLIKSELITNLGIAKDAMLEFNEIYKELGLEKYTGTTSRSYSPNSSSQTVNFNSPLINIEGNVDEGVMQNLEMLENRIVDKVCEEFISKTNGR